MMLAKLESILFVASKPLAFKTIARALGKQASDVEEAVENLILKYNRDDSGIVVVREGDTVQMVTNPAHADVVAKFVKDEVSGELTKAQLETLTVVGYRGPVTRAELEQIRGVNCAVILRNLLVRGLISEVESAKHVLPVYRISVDALCELGVGSVKELADYETLHVHEHVERAVSAEIQ